MPQEAPASKKNRSFEFLEIPGKFKEEDRLFSGNPEFHTSEREKGIFSKMMDTIAHGSLKVTLDDLESMIKKNSINEGTLDQHLRFYIRKDPQKAIADLKCIAQFLIEQTRQTGQTAGTQVVLLFKAIDCLRMVMQYDEGIDNIPSFMILQIISKMPNAFVSHMSREKKIFNLNISLQRAIKEGVPTISVRNKLASLLLQQKCFADVLFQYEKILESLFNQKPLTPKIKEKICVIYLNIGDLYKEIFSFEGDFKNGQILQNFIFRNNRDADLVISKRGRLKDVTGPINKMTVKEIYKELQHEAIKYYEKGLQYFPPDRNRKKRSEVLISIGKSYVALGKLSQAAKALRDSLLLLGKERNSEEVFKEKDEILTIIHTSVVKMPAGSEQDAMRSFVVSERNKLEGEQQEWQAQEQRKDEIRKDAARGTRKKVM